MSETPAKTGSAFMQKVRQLEAAYALGGPAALVKMSAIEAYVLLEEKSVALAAAGKMLKDHPGHERWMLRRDQLQAEVNHITGWLKEHVAPFNTRDKELER